jgi:hypothetical protein
VNRYRASLLLLCLGILAWQLLLPGFIGMANNGDFPKVAGVFCLEGIDHKADDFAYFQSDYVRGPQYCYDPGIPTSEMLPARLAVFLERTLHDPARFDIRWLGTLHALLFAGFYGLVLWLLRPFDAIAGTVLGLAALWIFADVSVVAYLNTFYSDVPAIIGALAAAILAAHLVRAEKPRPIPLLLFEIAALSLVTSKGQHAPLVIFPIGLLGWLAWRSRQRRIRLLAALLSMALLTGTAWVVLRTPAWFADLARFNLIFNKLANISPSPAQDLVELGLDEGDARYIGMHGFLPNNPMFDESWRRKFSARSNYAGLFRFYLRHPVRAVAMMQSDLYNDAWRRRVYSNFRRQDGHPPGAQTHRLASWGDLRTKLFRWWPDHILVWYAAVFAFAPIAAARERSPLRRALLWTMFWVALAGATDAWIAMLMDGAETARHLFLFHVLTDATMFLALVWAAGSRAAID